MIATTKLHIFTINNIYFLHHWQGKRYIKSNTTNKKYADQSFKISIHISTNFNPITCCLATFLYLTFDDSVIMAFGKTAELIKIKNAVLEDKLWRNDISAETRRDQNWNCKWGWILQEYKELHRKLAEVSKDSKLLGDINKNLRDPDTRSIKPVSDTTNHEYGWISSKKEFSYDRFGPDIIKPPPLPSLYKIFKFD